MKHRRTLRGPCASAFGYICVQTAIMRVTTCTCIKRQQNSCGAVGDHIYRTATMTGPYVVSFTWIPGHRATVRVCAYSKCTPSHGISCVFDDRTSGSHYVRSTGGTRVKITISTPSIFTYTRLLTLIVAQTGFLGSWVRKNESDTDYLIILTIKKHVDCSYISCVLNKFPWSWHGCLNNKDNKHLVGWFLLA